MGSSITKVTPVQGPPGLHSEKLRGTSCAHTWVRHMLGKHSNHYTISQPKHCTIYLFLFVVLGFWAIPIFWILGHSQWYSRVYTLICAEGSLLAWLRKSFGVLGIELSLVSTLLVFLVFYSLSFHTYRCFSLFSPRKLFFIYFFLFLETRKNIEKGCYCFFVFQNEKEGKKNNFFTLTFF